MAIGDDFTIDYVAQRITHTSGSTLYTVNQLYTYTTTTFDEPEQMDDLPPMSAQTPTAFTMENSWFIDPVSLQYLYGGSLTTLGWNHIAAYPNAVRKRRYDGSGANTGFEATDIGKVIVEAGGDNGIILYYDESIGEDQGYVWIRPATIDDTFVSVSAAYTVTGGTGAGAFAAAISTTGENTWANVFTLGTLASNTQIYLYQSNAEIAPWWSTGHIDVLILVKEAGSLIDYGNVTIFVRQYTKLYDHYVADLTAGARTPIPLATFDDSNNTSGYYQMVLVDATDTFTAGEVITDGNVPTIQGIVTSSTGTAPDITIQYYLFNSTQTNFSAVTGTFSSTTASASAVDPTDVGPNVAGLGITLDWTLITDKNLNNGDGPQQYDVVVDCNNKPLDDVYEYLKYITRYGSSTSINGHAGEAYAAVGNVRIAYSGMSGGTFTEGNTVGNNATFSLSTATGVIVADHTSSNPGTALILRDVVGTWTAADRMYDSVTPTIYADADAVETISPNKQAPFGSFAGGKFFGARGVWLANVPLTDSNNYQLIDSTNTPRLPPSSITLTVNGLVAGDQVGVYKATGDNNTVDKRTYSIYADQGSGVDYVDITGSAPNDTPGQLTGGYIRVVRYDGPTAAALIVSEQRYAYTGWVDNTTYTRFTVPGLTTQAYTAANDKVYVPFIDENSIAETDVSVGLIYVSARYITARVRKSGYFPFMIKSQITNSNLTITAVRATDSIAPLGV